jgi:hypothetical protein
MSVSFETPIMLENIPSEKGGSDWDKGKIPPENRVEALGQQRKGSSQLTADQKCVLALRV